MDLVNTYNKIVSEKRMKGVIKVAEVKTTVLNFFSFVFLCDLISEIA